MAETNTGHAYSYHDSVAQQASALPYSGLQGQAEPANRPHEPASAIVQEDYNCPICLDLLLEPVVGACGHEFGKDCYTRWLARSMAYPSCPLCRKVLAFAVPGKSLEIAVRGVTSSWGYTFAHREMLLPGVSRKLADLIVATFPEKILLRRYDTLAFSGPLGLLPVAALINYSAGAYCTGRQGSAKLPQKSRLLLSKVSLPPASDPHLLFHPSATRWGVTCSAETVHCSAPTCL